MTFQIAGFILNKTTKLKNIYFLNPLSDTCVFLELKTIRIDILIINYEQWVLLPISNYRLLIGKAVFSRLGSGENPHYSIEVVDDTQQYRVAVNVQSDDHSEVEYIIFSHWDHPIKDHIQKLPFGLHQINNKKGVPALDYIRANIARPQSFVSLPLNLIGPSNDLNELIDQYVWRAMADTFSKIYVFGSAWINEQKRDAVFGFFPGNGIHNVHMTQGEVAEKHKSDNGVWQDGGIIFEYSKPKQGVAICLKFKTQSWHTKDDDGNPIENFNYCPSVDFKSKSHGHSIVQTADGKPKGIIKIIAARIGNIGGPNKASVTILNISNSEIFLYNWRITDTENNQINLW